MDKEKVAIYCRISTEEKEALAGKQENESIINQKMLLQEYAKNQNWKIYDIYCDEDYSGLEEYRPEFQRMLQDAKEKKFSIILCKTQSRFTRSLELAERYLHHIFLLWGIRFVCVVDHVDTAIKQNKKERQILGLINEWYCEEISDNIRAVFRRKMEAGQFVGNFAPYGYQKSDTNHHQLVIHPETANVVQKIFFLSSEKGYSCKKIAQYLTVQKIPTPWQSKVQRGQDTGRKCVRHPGVWAETTVRRILHNQVYLGNLVQGKERKISVQERKVQAVPKEEWIVVKNTHEPIITPEQFEQVQKKKTEKKTKK